MPQRGQPVTRGGVTVVPAKPPEPPPTYEDAIKAGWKDAPPTYDEAMRAGWSDVTSGDSMSPLLEAPTPPPLHTPESTLGTRTREGILGAVEGMGIDPTAPITSGAKMIYSTLTAPSHAAAEAGRQRSFDPITQLGKNVVKGMVMTPLEYGGEAIEAAEAGDLDRFTNRLTAAITSAAPVVGGVVKGVQAAKFLKGTIPRHVTASLIKPDKASFDFGADPVRAVNDVGGISMTLPKLKERIVRGQRIHEQLLQRAIKERTNAAGATGAANASDISSAFTRPLNEAIDMAYRDQNRPLARRLERFRDGRLNEIQNKYGSTYLTPEQVLKEKRALANETKFSARSLDPLQVNLNTAKMGIYRGLDSVFDQMIPDAVEINHRYSGLIEAENLLDKRILEFEKSPLLSIERWRTLGGTLPKTAITSTLGAPDSPLRPVSQRFSLSPKRFELSKPNLPPAPRAMLTEGARPMPPRPDTSGISVTPAEPPRPVRGLLPPPTTVYPMPPVPPPASSVTATTGAPPGRPIAGLLPAAGESKGRFTPKGKGMTELSNLPRPSFVGQKASPKIVQKYRELYGALSYQDALREAGFRVD